MLLTPQTDCVYLREPEDATGTGAGAGAGTTTTTGTGGNRNPDRTGSNRYEPVPRYRAGVPGCRWCATLCDSDVGKRELFEGFALFQKHKRPWNTTNRIVHRSSTHVIDARHNGLTRLPWRSHSRRLPTRSRSTHSLKYTHDTALVYLVYLAPYEFVELYEFVEPPYEFIPLP